MYRLLLVAMVVLQAPGAVLAQERGRIHRKPPTAEEAARAAVEMAKNDNLLRKGDIVATDRGFLVFRGVAADGMTNEFAPAAHPRAGSR